MNDRDERRVLAQHQVTAEDLAAVRNEAAGSARGAGLAPDRADRFAFAVHEIVANPVEHGGGTGELTLIQDDATLLYADVVDHGTGTIAPGPYPRPPIDAPRRRGLWLSQELCDDLWLSSGPDGAVVRVQMDLDEPDRDRTPVQRIDATDLPDDSGLRDT